LIGPENILRLEPTGQAAAIDLADWETAVAQLPEQAKSAFDEHHDRIAAFFSGVLLGIGVSSGALLLALSRRSGLAVPLAVR
jgi:hypothetical protein